MQTLAWERRHPAINDAMPVIRLLRPPDYETPAPRLLLLCS